jgi:hypothetical protein
VRLQRRAAVHAVVRGHADPTRRRRHLGSPRVALAGGGVGLGFGRTGRGKSIWARLGNASARRPQVGEGEGEGVLAHL